MQRDHVPHLLGPRRLHAGVEQHRSHHIGAPHLETLGSIEPSRQADIVQDRADVQHFHVDLHGLGSSHERGELKAAFAVGDDMRRAAVVHQVVRPLGELRVGRVDRGIAHDPSLNAMMPSPVREEGITFNSPGDELGNHMNGAGTPSGTDPRPDVDR